MLLDTDVLVDVVRQHSAAVLWTAGISPAPTVPGYAAMELLNGARDSEERRKLEQFLSGFRIVWPSEAALASMLWQFTGYRLAGGVGMIDALIASTALDRDEALATFNAKHYQMAPGLKILRPYDR